MIKFIEKRKNAFLVSGALILLSIYATVVKKINWGIDFTGGTLAQVSFKKDVSIESLRAKLSEFKPVIQRFANTNTFLLKFSQIKQQDISVKLNTILMENFKESEPQIEKFEMVGPVVGKFLIKAAIYAFFGAFIGIIFYVAIRFKGGIWGIAAVIALIHDVFITFGILCLMNYTIDLIIITGLLFIAGYSVNDTIVIYDRIRENLRKGLRKSNAEIFDTSINQTLSRTLVTSLTTLLVVATLLLLGGMAIKSFAITLFIGIIIGTYSSIFIASPLVYITKK